MTPPEIPDPVIINVPGKSLADNSPKSVFSETPDVSQVELSASSIPSDSLDVPLGCEDFDIENTTCEQCGFKSKSSRGLKVHVRTQHRISQIDGSDDIVKESESLGTQTEETCDYCRDIIESLEKHHVSGFCPKNIEAQRLALFQRYGQHSTAGQGQGFPAWMINQPRVQY